MSQKPLARQQMQEALDAVYVHRTQVAAAKALGINRLTLAHRYRRALEEGLKPTPGLQQLEETPDLRLPKSAFQAALEAVERHGGSVHLAALELGIPRSTLEKRYQRALQLGLKPAAQNPEEALRAGRAYQSLMDRNTRLRNQLLEAYRALNEREELRQALFQLTSDPVKVPNWGLPEARPSKEAEMPILFVSDWQWGEVISAERLGGFNAFNPQVAEERVRLLVAKTIELAFQHRGVKRYPGIYYFRGGDMVSGEIHDELRETNAQQAGSAARHLVSVEAWAIRELRKAFRRVHVKTVPGNHGRTTAKPRSKEEVADNFDGLSHFWLESLFAGDPNVTFDAPASGDALVPVYGYTFCLTHGDKVGSRGGQGFLGAVATIVRGMEKTFRYYAKLRVIVDYILMGHHHVGMKLEWGFSNGSLPGYSEFAKIWRLTPMAPEQWLLFVHPEYGVNDAKNIMLGPHPKISMELP